QPYYVIRVDLVPNIQQGEANFADNAATTSFGVRQPPAVLHSISGWLADTQGNRLAGVTVNLSGDATATTTTAFDGSYYFDVAQPGLYRVEPGAVPDGELYPKDAQGNTYREVEIIDPAKGVSNVSFTQNQRASFVKLLFPRAGDKLQGDFGLFGTAFRYTGCVTETDCPLIDGLLLSINGTQIYSGTLLGGASDRFALSQVVWRDMQGKPVNASWEQLIPGSGDVSLQVGVHNREDGWGFSEAVIVSRANTTATAGIQPDVTLPAVAPTDVTLNSQITGATADRTAWFVFRRDENGEEFDARHPDETASIIESYPKEDVYPSGLAVVDNDGNTLVDVLHASVYRPAYKGDPRMSRAGSRLAALGVNVVSGNFYYQTTDMSLSGVGLPFELWRRYSSLSYPNEDQERSELGQGGWGHSYDYAIFLSKSGRRLFLALPDGHWERYAYVEDADGQNRQWRTEVPGSPYRVVENGNGFKVYDRDQTAYTFDHVYWTSEHGGVFRPTRIEDTNGNALEIAYDANHRVATITDTLPTPRISILFTYNAEGFLSKVADGTGRDVEYFYNAGGNLATFRDRRGQVWVYNYVDCAGKTLLSRISDPLGNDLITNTYSYVTSGVPLTHYDGYDGECRVTSQTDGQGNQWTISYNSPSETVVTNPLSQTTTYVINDTHMVTQVTDPNNGVASKSYTLDAVEVRDRTLANTLTSPRQLDTQLSYAGSVQGNPTQITDPANRQMTLTWQEDANAQNSSCTTNPDPETGGCNNRNLLTALRLPGTSQDYTLSYDANSQVDRVTDPLTRTVNYAYNSRGQVTQRTDPLGRITAYSYDPQGFLTKTTDPLNNEETYTYDAQGRIQTTTNRRGYTTTLEYNENDQLTRLTDPNGNAIVYSYDNAGNLTAVQDKRGFTTTYTYNGANRLATATRSDGQGHTYAVTYQYDGLLRLRQVTNARNYATTRTYAPSATGEQQTVVNPLGEYTVMQYDLDGHLTQVEQRAANDSVLETLEYTRDALGRVLTATRRRADNNPLTTTYTYNELGKVASIRDPKQITTSLEYDEIGRLTQTRRDIATVAIAYDETSVLPNYRVIVTDPNNHDTVYTYDALDRLISKTDPLGNIWRYEYDGNGNLRYYRDADNQATEFVYDKLDRLTLLRYPDGSTVDYDHDGNGNVVSLTDTLGVSTQTFDGLNRLLSRADSFGQTVGYGYDGNSNVTAITYPGSHTVNYGYDPVDRMTSVQDWLGNTTTYSYDAASRLVGIVNGNGTRVALSYDPAGRLTGYANRQSDNSVISEHQYVLDDNGNPITATVTQPLPVNLTPASHSFSYDQANRLLSGPEGSVQHDTDGNLTVENRGAQQIQYSYDDADRLTGWTDGTDNYAYRYAGNGVRMATVENGVETRYVVDMNKGLPDVLARTDDTGQVQDYFVYGAAGLINRITPAGDSYVYHFDPTGSTLAMTDATESIVNQYAYTPYGQVRRQTTVDNPFEYIGRYGVMAEANGLNYMRARFYHPDFRRFVSQDPIWGDAVEAQSLNAYAYVGGSPISRVDPSGLYRMGAWLGDLGNAITGGAQATVRGVQVAAHAGKKAGRAAGEGMLQGMEWLGNTRLAQNIYGVSTGFGEHVLDPVSDSIVEETTQPFKDGYKNVEEGHYVAATINYASGIIPIGGYIKGLLTAPVKEYEETQDSNSFTDSYDKGVRSAIDIGLLFTGKLGSAVGIPGLTSDLI
ncbi:MAG: RHS repeat protein, partial [Candidatus Competibacteraceae bacterium]|nr:RHS repeat protein [Candidatus Competibacteraceae bacterium]